MHLLFRSLFVNIVHLQHRFPHNIWRRFWTLVQVEEKGKQWTSKCWFIGGSCSPVTVHLCLSFLAERSHGWIRVSHDSSVSTQSFISSFPKQTLFYLHPFSYVISLSNLCLQIIGIHRPGYLLLNVHPHLMHLLWALPTPPSVPVRGRGQGEIYN